MDLDAGSREPGFRKGKTGASVGVLDELRPDIKVDARQAGAGGLWRRVSLLSRVCSFDWNHWIDRERMLCASCVLVIGWMSYVERLVPLVVLDPTAYGS